MIGLPPSTQHPKTGDTPGLESESSGAFFVGRGHRRGAPRSPSRWETAEASPNAIARDVGPVIYAMRQPGGIIKIGHTANIANRISSLGGWKHLIALKPATRADELALHKTLRAHVHHGREYYNATPEVLAVVNDMRSALRLDPIAD